MKSRPYKTTQVVSPEPGIHNPWGFIGALQSALRNFGEISPKDWETALEIAERIERQHQTR